MLYRFVSGNLDYNVNITIIIQLPFSALGTLNFKRWSLSDFEQIDRSQLFSHYYFTWRRLFERWIMLSTG